MLTKILITVAVIIIVAIVFRTKAAPTRSSTVEPPDERGTLSVRGVTYALLGILLLIAAGIFIIKFQADNKIITIRVISDDGISTVYQARQKTIKGRHFTTLDNKQVTLGESDRIEMDGR